MLRGKKSPTVNVSVLRKTRNGPLQISVFPDHLNLKDSCYHPGPLTITWNLDTVGYQFSIDPPAIEFTSPDSEKTFSDLKLHDHGRRATVHDKNSDGLAFSYNLHVQEVATGLKAFLDPVVQNNDK